MAETKKLKIVGPPAGDEELRLWLVQHMEQHPHLTPVILARSDHIGGSRTLIDQYAAGTYFLPVEEGGSGVSPERSKIERSVRAYREKVEGTVRHGYQNTFAQTFSYRQLLSAWDTAIAENIIVVCYGNPGVGKSRCLTELSVTKMTTMPITILCSANVTVRYFVQRLAQEVGIPHNKTIPELEDLVAEKLKRAPRPIVVDQANYLNEKSLGTLCYLWEIARIPIMLIGTHDLHDLFTKSNLTQDVRAQLTSRVAMHYPLAELSAGECKAILKRALGDTATDEIVALIYNKTGKTFRSLEFFIPRFKELQKLNSADVESGRTSTEKLVNTAASRLMVMTG